MHLLMGCARNHVFVWQPIKRIQYLNWGHLSSEFLKLYLILESSGASFSIIVLWLVFPNGTDAAAPKITLSSFPIVFDDDAGIIDSLPQFDYDSQPRPSLSR